VTADALPPDPDERLARLVHDLRTPLTVVEGFAGVLLRDEDLDPRRRQEALTRLAAAAREMREILDAERASRPVR
jgi:signal transduction histidine kinase